MKVGDLCTHNDHHDWGIGGVIEVVGDNAVVLFVDVGRRHASKRALAVASPHAAPDVLLERDRWEELALELPASASNARPVTGTDLVFAIRRGQEVQGSHIVGAVEFVRAWLQRHQLLTGERTENPRAPYNGPLWEAADIAACRARGLQKWRRSNGRIGWSLPIHAKLADRLAVQDQWERIDRDDESWRYHYWDGSRWVFRGTSAR